MIANAVRNILMSFLCVKLRFSELPKGVDFTQMLGVSFLAGVGFTMSIFIANLAFVENVDFIDSAKIGILIGSFISGSIGYIIIKLSIRNKSLAHENQTFYASN